MLDDRAINLTFSEAARALVEACGLNSDAGSAIEARIKQLQRLGVSAREGTASTKRLEYGLSELAALATAIRLTDAFMVPTLAARYVTERWTVLAPALVAGAAEAMPSGYLLRWRPDAGTIIAIEGNALAELGQRGRHDERYDGDLGAIEVLPEDNLGKLVALIGGAGVLLDTRSYMPALIESTTRLAMATGAEISSELDRMRFGERPADWLSDQG